MLTNSATAASFMTLTIRLVKLSAAACSALMACSSLIVDIETLPPNSDDEVGRECLDSLVHPSFAERRSKDSRHAVRRTPLAGKAGGSGLRTYGRRRGRTIHV